MYYQVVLYNASECKSSFVGTDAVLQTCCIHVWQAMAVIVCCVQMYVMRLKSPVRFIRPFKYCVVIFFFRGNISCVQIIYVILPSPAMFLLFYSCVSCKFLTWICIHTDYSCILFKLQHCTYTFSIKAYFKSQQKNNCNNY